MRAIHVGYLCCPACTGDLQLSDGSDDVIDGEVTCVACGSAYPVVRGIPRFVPRANYARGFGLQWNRHARTQYDGESKVPLSEHRIFYEAGVPRQLPDAIIVEAGSGSGRFTEQLLKTGATVLSFDYSDAVDANYASNGMHPNLLLMQADIFRPPIRRRSADFVLCLGVVQHTPEPRNALLTLHPLLKRGGVAIADVYRKTWRTYIVAPKYWVRPVTRGRDPRRLYRFVIRYVDFMWPLATLIRRLPRGANINWALLIADYSNVGVPESVLKEWAYLNTFDMLAPQYDLPQTKRTIQRWLADAGIDAEVTDGLNGIAVRMYAPAALGSD